MRNLKKFLALVLAMVMAFSLMVTANAAKDVNARDIYPDAGNITEEFKEAVDVLYGMGVMTGDYGSFKPEQGILRSEMAAVLYRLMTGDTNALKNNLYAEVAASRFTDVKESDWFAPYIGWCYDAGIMVGSNGYFRPWANVTGYETLVMVLRAMGYGKNHEYTGIGWNVNASSDGTLVGLLKDVSNSSYSNTLAMNTRRDVVASIVFQAAQLPTVTYTPSLGYNKYIGVASAQGGNILNPSLGETYFGLTSHVGIVVGNQATGETGKYATKIGFSVNPTIVKSADLGAIGGTTGATESSIKGTLTDAVIIDTCGDGAYQYATDNTTAGNITLSFDWKTDLTLFNHKVKVWYDGRGTNTTSVGVNGANYVTSSVSFGTNCTTYALYDQAKSAVVNFADATAANVTSAALAGLLDGRADNQNNWNDTVFRTKDFFVNYSFGRNNATRVANLGAATVSVSPILMNDDNTAYPLYLVISNSTNNGIDVVIPLDMTVSQIVQANTTTYPYSVGVENANGTNNSANTLGTNAYFGDKDDLGRLTNTGYGTSFNYVSLINEDTALALVDTDEASQKLGAKIVAIEITGTNGTQAATDDGAGATTGMAPAAFGTYYGLTTTDGSTFYYKLQQNTLHKTGKVVKVDTANNDVYLEGVAEPLHRSVFAEAVDGSFIPDDSAVSGNEGYRGTGAIGFRLIAGRDYTFTLDEQGNYIYWETADVTSNFVYGTYIDFETKVASSQFNYPMVNVNAKGDARQVDSITSVDNNVMGTVEYDNINLNKRDDNTQGNNSGYVPGKYIGYALNSSTGALTSITALDSKGTGFLQGGTNAAGAGVFSTGAITVNANSVAVGAQQIDVTGMFLTENTQFYIVDGAGTENQTVTPYKGVSGLMEGCSTVVIDGVTSLTSVTAGDFLDPALCTNPYEMFYYEAGRFTYDQNYDPSALEIKTLFLPAVCVTRNLSSNSDLVFVGKSTGTMINSNNGNWATQFTVWNDGTPSNVWIAGDYTDATTDVNSNYNDAYLVANNGDNVFYELVATSNKATDGNTIYQIRGVSNAVTGTGAGNRILGQYWDGTRTATGVQISPSTKTAPLTYKATTFNQQAAYIDDAVAHGGSTAKLYNVGSAGIKNLDTVTYPGILDNNRTTLNGAGSLANNDGVPVSCVLDTNDALRLTVSFIYVNA